MEGCCEGGKEARRGVGAYRRGGGTARTVPQMQNRPTRSDRLGGWVWMRQVVSVARSLLVTAAPGR